MKRLAVIIGNKYSSYLSSWCSMYASQCNDTCYLISQLKHFKDFIDHLSMAYHLDNSLSKCLTPTLSRRILIAADILFDISKDHNLLTKFAVPTVNKYEFEYKFSNKYKCSRCGYPCDFQEIQVRIGDEESDIYLFCNNCGLQQRRHL